MDAVLSLRPPTSLDVDHTRPIDPWKRYRALNDAMDEVYELIDINNREARFALILMGSLNAVAVVGGSRVDFLSSLAPNRRIWVMALVGVYVVVAMVLMFHAVSTLRPRHFRPRLGGWLKSSKDYPKGIRYFEDVIARDPESYWAAWREVSIDQLNAELAVQLHSLCMKCDLKRRALRQLYEGLRVMVLLLAIVAVILFIAAWQ